MDDIIKLRDQLRIQVSSLNRLLAKDDKRFERSNERLYIKRETIVEIGKKLTSIINEQVN